MGFNSAFKGLSVAVLKKQSWHQGGVVLRPEGWVVVNDSMVQSPS